MTEMTVDPFGLRRIAELEAEIGRLRARLANPFVSYEVVRCAEPVGGKPSRYHIYGITPDGVKVSLDYLYLREHDNALKQAEAKLAAAVKGEK